MSSNQCNSFCASAENWCNSKIQLHEAKYIWIIDNFDFHEAAGKYLRSPTFSAVTNHQVKWSIVIGPNGEAGSTDTVSCFVTLSPDSALEKIFAKFSVAVLDSQQKEVFITSVRVCKFELNNAMKSNWGKRELFKKTAHSRNSYIFNNRLTIKCNIIFSLTTDTLPLSNINHNCNAVPFYSNRSVCNLVENLGMLFENHKFSDMVLSVKNKEYPVHRNILAARSSVFAAMFEHNFKENETNRIEIEDMNEETGFEMLRYIYTGKCENAEKLADGLLAAADKYDLDQLKIICAEALYKTLSVDNALNILALADLHSVAELKSATIKFIVSKFAEVVASTAWKNILLSHPSLIDEVCQAVAGRPSVPGKMNDQDSGSELGRSSSE